MISSLMVSPPLLFLRKTNKMDSKLLFISLLFLFAAFVDGQEVREGLEEKKVWNSSKCEKFQKFMSKGH